MDVHTFRIVIAVTFAVAVSWTAFALPAEAGSGADFASPLSGPGVDTVKKSQQRKIQKGWQELTDGKLRESQKRVARLGELAPAQLLKFQIRLTEDDTNTMEELSTFCEKHPDYASAWITLSVAAQRAGSELVALRAARRAGDLWKTSPWGNRAAELEQQWITDRIVAADRLFEGGDHDAALAELESANALDPKRRDSILLGAKISFANGRFDEATDLLTKLPEDSDARFLEGQIAESRQNWSAAMESYSNLPEEYPERASALQRAQIQWRLTLLPAYARESMAADQVTRGDLAVVLVSIQPRLETLPGGAVPVMSDIVDHPGQREIITVVRLGIMTADRRGHLFYPKSNASIENIREAIQQSRALLGLAAPIWCSESDVVGSACTAIPSPTSGGSIVNAVLDLASGAGL